MSIQKTWWLTITQAAKWLGLPRLKVYSWVCQGKIKATRNQRGHYKIPLEEIGKLRIDVEKQQIHKIIDLLSDMAMSPEDVLMAGISWWIGRQERRSAGVMRALEETKKEMEKEKA